MGTFGLYGHLYPQVNLKSVSQTHQSGEKHGSSQSVITFQCVM